MSGRLGFQERHLWFLPSRSRSGGSRQTMGSRTLVGISGRPRGAEGGGGVLPPEGPGGAGPAAPPCASARHQLRARKNGRSPALCRELKMEDAAARESGWVSHPHKGKGPVPPRPPLPVTPWRAGHSPGVSVSPRGLLSGASSGGGRGLGEGVSPHLVGGDASWAGLALVVTLLGICPLHLGRGSSSLWFGGFKVFFFPPPI